MRARSAVLSMLLWPALALGLGSCGQQSMFTSAEPIVYEACGLAEFQASLWRKTSLSAKGKGDTKTQLQASWVQARIIAGSPTCFDDEAVEGAVERLTEEPPGD